PGNRWLGKCDVVTPRCAVLERTGMRSGGAVVPFSPLVRGWFVERFGSPTSAQEAGWPAVAAGADTLIAAPTGSGKTLAAFLWSLDRLLDPASAAALYARHRG